MALAIALVMASPLLIWNAANDFITFRHTATNVGWKFPFVHPLAMLDYIVVQFGVFGPILMVVLLRATGREFAHRTDQRKALLLAFSLPVLGLLLMQSLLSRAHGNWSGVAYPAATILVTSVMIELGRRRLFQISLGLHLAVAGVLAAAPAFATQSLLFERLQFLSRVVGWRGVAGAVREKLASDRYAAIVVDTRELAATLLYYLRDVPTPLYAWPSGPLPASHYEMKQPYITGSPEPALFVSLRRCPRDVEASFSDFSHVGTVSVPIVKEKERTLHFCRLAGRLDE
jgi:hypothetical protein